MGMGPAGDQSALAETLREDAGDGDGSRAGGTVAGHVVLPRPEALRRRRSTLVLDVGDGWQPLVWPGEAVRTGARGPDGPGADDGGWRLVLGAGRAVRVVREAAPTGLVLAAMDVDEEGWWLCVDAAVERLELVPAPGDETAGPSAQASATAPASRAPDAGPLTLRPGSRPAGWFVLPVEEVPGLPRPATLEVRGVHATGRDPVVRGLPDVADPSRCVPLARLGARTTAGSAHWVRLAARWSGEGVLHLRTALVETSGAGRPAGSGSGR